MVLEYNEPLIGALVTIDPDAFPGWANDHGKEGSVADLTDDDDLKASVQEAIELANRSKYGLGSTVYTTNLDEANRAVNELEAGMVWVNAPLLDNDAGPFGGRKMSGIGRQLGAEGLDSFRHTKLAMIDPGCADQDFWWFPYKDEEAGPGQ